MSKPEFEKITPNNYRFTWPELNIEASTSQIKDHSGDVKVDLVVLPVIGADPQHNFLYRGRDNINSSPTKKRIAKEIQELTGAEQFDWAAMIQAICVRTIDEYRKGEPVVRLSDMPPVPEKRFLLKPLLPVGQPSIFYGYGGNGKSYIAAYFASLISEGYTTPQLLPDPGEVLYLDYEVEATTAQYRFEALYEGLGITSKPNILYRFCYQPFAKEIAAIQDIVAANNIQLIIIDSAAAAAGGQAEEAAATSEFFGNLRSLKTTSMILAHRAKNTENSTPFGSVFWTNYARNVFEVKKSQEQDSDIAHFGLYHVKVNDGKPLKPFGFKFHFNGGSIHVDHEDVQSVPDLAQPPTALEEIQDAVSRKPKSPRELAEELDMNMSTVHKTYKRNENKTLIKTPEGKIALKAYEK